MRMHACMHAHTHSHDVYTLTHDVYTLQGTVQTMEAALKAGLVGKDSWEKVLGIHTCMLFTYIHTC